MARSAPLLELRVALGCQILTAAVTPQERHTTTGMSNEKLHALPCLPCVQSALWSTTSGHAVRQLIVRLILLIVHSLSQLHVERQAHSRMLFDSAATCLFGQSTHTQHAVDVWDSAKSMTQTGIIRSLGVLGLHTHA